MTQDKGNEDPALQQSAPAEDQMRAKSGGPWMAGLELKSVKSGFPGMDSAIIADAWDDVAAKGFRLAPRICILDVAKRDDGAPPEGSARKLPQPLDGLPLHMSFREDPTSQAGEMRQSWLSEAPDRWSWLLVVDSVGGVLTGTLTATPPSGTSDAEPAVWRTKDPWRFFEDNELLPGDGQSPPFDVPLLVVAP